MIEIIEANEAHIEVLAILGTVTYAESHSCFIENKQDLREYLKSAFSITKIKEEIKDLDNHFYLILKYDLPVGYAKLVKNADNINVISDRACLLERIYILGEFIDLKIGQPFLDFLEQQVNAMGMHTIWLSVYSKNVRAIQFYEKNKYKLVGKTSFQVNQTEYKNLVFSKKIENEGKL